MTSSAKEFTRAASILGIFVVGGLIANYGGTSLRIVVGDPAINIQGLLDGVLPKLIPLLITLGIYVLIKKAGHRLNVSSYPCSRYPWLCIRYLDR
mgnify:FL=1